MPMLGPPFLITLLIYRKVRRCPFSALFPLNFFHCLLSSKGLLKAASPSQQSRTYSPGGAAVWNRI